MKDILSKKIIEDNIEYTPLDKISDKQITKFNQLLPGHAYGWECEKFMSMRDKSKQITSKYPGTIFFVLNKTKKWAYITYFKFETDLRMIDYAKGNIDFFEEENKPSFGYYYFGKVDLIDEDYFNRMIKSNNELSDDNQKIKDNFIAGKKRNIGPKSPFAEKYPHYDILTYVTSKGLYEYDLDLSILDNFYLDDHTLSDKYKCDLVYPKRIGNIFDDPDARAFRDACLSKR